jgi:pimeloyl-ACP methyl ester carboxylesterase
VGRAALAADKKRAKRQHALIGFQDESGVSLLPAVRATWAPTGQTPVLHHHFGWKRLSVAGALVYEPDGSDAQLLFAMRPGAYETETLIQFLSDLDMVRKLEAAPVTMAGGMPPGYVAMRDEAMHRLGVGTMHTMTNYLQGLFLASFQTREYTIGEKVGLWRGKFAAGVSPLLGEITTTDLSEILPALNLPVYFLHGSYDYTVNYSLAKAYADQLRAPLKGFYTFAQSAHSPMFEEPEKTQRILREDVLAATNHLSDAPQLEVANAG